MEKKIMLSVGRPTGKLHLGHYVGAFKGFAEIQYNYNSFFIISFFNQIDIIVAFYSIFCFTHDSPPL